MLCSENISKFLQAVAQPQAGRPFDTRAWRASVSPELVSSYSLTITAILRVIHLSPSTPSTDGNLGYNNPDNLGSWRSHQR